VGVGQTLSVRRIYVSFARVQVLVAMVVDAVASEPLRRSASLLLLGMPQGNWQMRKCVGRKRDTALTPTCGESVNQMEAKEKKKDRIIVLTTPSSQQVG
jgi:hypothetical protein